MQWYQSIGSWKCNNCKSYHPATKILVTFHSVYDVTIGYKNRCPSFLDNVFGVDPSEVHIHIRCIPIDTIPVSESEMSTWLINRFQLKDQLLSNFQIQGQFPDPATQRDLSAVKSILNCMTIVAVTGTCMYYSFSSLWFKLYVSLVCSYLVPATYFNIRPQPIHTLLKTRSNCHLSNTWIGGRHCLLLYDFCYSIQVWNLILPLPRFGLLFSLLKHNLQLHRSYVFYTTHFLFNM